MKEDRLTTALALEEAVEDALQGDHTLAANPVAVAIEGATVTLSGTVASPLAKAHATVVAGTVSGVLEVINALVVETPTPRGGTEDTSAGPDQSKAGTDAAVVGGVTAAVVLRRGR
jgi:hypothetical protein